MEPIGMTIFLNREEIQSYCPGNLGKLILDEIEVIDRRVIADFVTTESITLRGAEIYEMAGRLLSAWFSYFSNVRGTVAILSKCEKIDFMETICLNDRLTIEWGTSNFKTKLVEDFKGKKTMRVIGTNFKFLVNECLRVKIPSLEFSVDL